MYRVESDLDGLLKRLKNCQTHHLSLFHLNIDDLHFLMRRKLLRNAPDGLLWDIQYTIDQVSLMVITQKLS